MPAPPDSHNLSAAITGDPRGLLGAQGQPLTAGPQSVGKQFESSARAAAPGPVRMLRTALGMVEVFDLPNNTQQLRFPSSGAFDVVIVESSPGATIPDAERLLTGRPVQTVFLTLGTGQDWTLQYCLPANGSAAAQAGMVVTLGEQPKVEAPFIQQALIPSQRVVLATRPALFQGALSVNGRFVRLRPVIDAVYQPFLELLPYLEQWQFRPAKVDGVPTEVEVLLLVPPITRQ
jgi:hypothetical protein